MLDEPSSSRGDKRGKARESCMDDGIRRAGEVQEEAWEGRGNQKDTLLLLLGGMRLIEKKICRSLEALLMRRGLMRGIK